MALDFTKVVYTDGTTVIYAANLNAIQDALLWLDAHKQDALTIDDTVTEGSENPVTGGAVYLAISAEDTALRQLLAGKLAAAAFAPAYSDSGVYAVGDLRTWQDLAYRCTTAITTPEAFDAAHWEAVTVVELTDELAAALQQLQDDLDDLTDDVGALRDAAPHVTSVTLTAAGWNNNKQTATVAGILADETRQLIEPIPAAASASAYVAAGVLAVEQAANAVVFRCVHTPTADLTVYIVVTEVIDNAE